MHFGCYFKHEKNQGCQIVCIFSNQKSQSLYFFPVLVCSTKKNLATLNELLSKNHFCQLAVVRVLTVFEFAATNKQ
jgi:hypothetical protein